MIKIIVSGTVLIKGAPKGVVRQMEEFLTYPNPAYKEALKHGRYIGENLQPYLYYFDSRKGNIVVPRGSLNYFLGLVHNKERKIKDITVKPKMSIKPQFTSKLRPYQKAAFKDITNKRYGILEANTGAGKTVMGAAYVCKRKTRALIIVHNKTLLNQWVEAFQEHTNITDIGRIGDGYMECRDVTIGIINSVHKYAEQIRDKFGTVIYDECHRVQSNMWITAINALRPKYHLGLSATPFRRDKLTMVLYQMIGPQLHKVDPKELERSGAILRPTIIRRTTGFTYTFKNDYSAMLSTLTKDERRNRLIAADVIHDMKAFNEPIMIVTDRVAHCKAIFEELKLNASMKPVILTGQMPADQRKRNLASIKAGTANCLIATIQLLGEGFDAPDLSAMFLATPVKFSGRLVQVVGRILRPSGSNRARVYDYRDNRIETFRRTAYSRDRVYNDRDWK